MKTKCNHCNKEYNIENKYDGYLMECPECKESFLVEELDNILVKKSIKGIFKKNPALVGAACCLFLAVILNFISNFFFLLWGPLYLVVFILGIVAIVQQKPFKGISFIVASLLLPLIICLVNIFWVGAVLNDAIKNKNKRNFYKTSAKSKKIQMDFFNTDPFANSSSIKKQIKKTKHKYSQKKIEKAQKKLKPINKPVIVLTSPASPKETKVSPVLTKKRDELNNKKLINVYSGSMKPQPIINTKRKVKVHQVSAVLFKKPETSHFHPKKIVEVLNIVEFRKKLLPFKLMRINTNGGKRDPADWVIEINELINGKTRKRFKYLKSRMTFDRTSYTIMKIDSNQSRIFLKSRGGQYTIIMQVDKPFYSPKPRVLIKNLTTGMKLLVSVGDTIQMSNKLKYKVFKVDKQRKIIIIKDTNHKKYTIKQFTMSSYKAKSFGWK